MFKINKKVPMGLAALCVVSLFGLKDTGIFLNAHVQTTYSGNKIAFQKGEEVQVIEKTDNGYIVAKDNAKVTIPAEKIEMKNNVDVYKVTKAAPIKNANGVIRNLFIGEELALIEDKNDSVVVKCSDGVVGEVAKNSLELVATSAKKEENKIAKVNMVKVDQAASNKIIVGKAIAVKNDEKGSDIANKAVESALNKVGSKYVWGATGDGGYDCSGLVYSVYKNELGIKNLPRTSREQANFGQPVDKSNLKRGDLLFFSTLGGSTITHVGIYMGNGEFVHASTGVDHQVKVSKLNEDYYTSRFVKATRVV